MTATRLGLPRQLAKTLNFLIAYGGSPKRLQREIAKKNGEHWELPRCVTAVSETQALYPVLWAYIASVHAQVVVDGYVTTPLGHRRLFPHAQTSTDESVLEEDKREAWNHCCQSLGHGLLERAARLIQEHVHRERLDWMLVNDLHDNLLYEVPVAAVDDVCRVVRHAMTAQAPRILGDWLLVPMTSDAKVGTHFGNLQDYVPAQTSAGMAATRTERPAAALAGL